MTEREQTNHLLRQAHHYVITEEDNDSPANYIDCIQRIDRDLLQKILEQGYDCDPKLYRRVRQKIDHVQREFEDAIGADFILYDYEELSGCYRASEREPLYRVDSSPATPGFSSARLAARLNAKDELEEGVYFCGPTSHPVHWYKIYSASLQFPETIRMNGCESLWTDCDLVVTGDQDGKDPDTSVVAGLKTHPIAYHDSMAQCDFASRLSLPTIDRSDTANSNNMSTVNELPEAVDVSKRGDCIETMNGKYKCTPQVFLDRPCVDHQNHIRNAINRTPSRPRSSDRGSGKIISTPPAIRTLLNKQPQVLPFGLSKEDTSHVIDIDRCYDLPVISKPSHRNKPCTHTATPKLSLRSARVRSTAIHCIEASIQSFPRPQCSPGCFETTQPKVAVSVFNPAKKVHDRQRKSPTAEINSAEYQAALASTKFKMPRKDANCKPVVAEEESAEGTEGAKVVSAKRKRTATTCGMRVRIKNAQKGNTNPLPQAPTILSVMAVRSASDSPVVFTPLVGKAKVAAKQKKTRTKGDFSEVNSEKHEDLVAERGKGATAEGHKRDNLKR